MKIVDADSESGEADVGSDRPDHVEPQAFAFALSEAFRALVERSETFELPSLGKFRVLHHPSRIVQSDEGAVVVEPPHNEVEFDPNATDAPP